MSLWVSIEKAAAVAATVLHDDVQKSEAAQEDGRPKNCVGLLDAHDGALVRQPPATSQHGPERSKSRLPPTEWSSVMSVIYIVEESSSEIKAYPKYLFGTVPVIYE